MYKNCKCKICGLEFRSKYKTTLCSDICKNKLFRDQQRARKNVVEVTKECQHCHTEFSTAYSRQKYCSDKCRLSYPKDKTHSEIGDFWVFARDNFTCVYCGKSSILDGVSLQVDHVYPFTKGGDNSYFNLVTACRSCNSSKGNKLLSVDVIKTIWTKNIEYNTSSFEEIKDKLNIISYEKSGN